jgi:hypothetical protein
MIACTERTIMLRRIICYSCDTDQGIRLLDNGKYQCLMCWLLEEEYGIKYKQELLGDNYELERE